MLPAAKVAKNRSNPKASHRPATYKKKKHGKRRGFISKVLDEVWDEIEDIFD